MDVRNYETDVFADLCLNHADIRWRFHSEVYKASQIVQSRGAEIKHFGIVKEGLLKAENNTFQGVDLCNTYFECGDVFPEFLYFTGTRIYTYTLVAVKRTTVCWIPAHQFEELIQEDHKLMYSFMLYMSQRGLKNQLLINCLNYHSIRQRIAYWLLGMNDLSENEVIPLPCSQTVWANTLHVSRSSLNQELKRMEEKGYFRIEERHLTLLDQSAMELLL